MRGPRPPQAGPWTARSIHPGPPAHPNGRVPVGDLDDGARKATTALPQAQPARAVLEVASTFHSPASNLIFLEYGRYDHPMHSLFETALERVSLVVAVSTAALVGLAGSPGSVAGAAPTGGGPVSVLYAGSLVTVMQDGVGPAFQRATGYTVSGYAGGSDDLANQIKGGIEKADVFISASPAVNTELEGAANGNWVSWYATFAASPLVIGYNPNSSFAKDLATKPWYDVITKTGFQLGRTDPITDPKGVLAVSALDKAAKLFHSPALRAITTSTAGVFPEETLVGRLQAGQLDARVFYRSEERPGKKG